MAGVQKLWPDGFDVVDASQWFDKEAPGYVVVKHSSGEAIYTGRLMSVWEAIARLNVRSVAKGNR